MLKYFTEFGLNAYADYLFLTQQDALEKLEEEVFQEIPCYIYIIGRKPRVTLEPSSFKIDDSWVQGTLKFQRQNHFESRDFIIPNKLGKSELRLDCPYPYSEFSLYDENNKHISFVKAGVLAHLFPEMAEFVDIEVLYVGQAYGNQGGRQASERLQSHSTLQKIYHEVSRRTPDQDVWLLLLNFEVALYTIFNGQCKNFQVSDEEDNRHVKYVLKTGITEEQAINFTEAALIRYFEPEYNEIFKNSFPNPAHKTYSQCYDLDINSVVVTIETDNLGCMLWSKRRRKNWMHIATFPLHNSEERKSLFHALSSV
ncbi:MAG TPA: hypothetical protein V6C78_06420 [Crinalium sp.]|jgi:hypothetical protein